MTKFHAGACWDYLIYTFVTPRGTTWGVCAHIRGGVYTPLGGCKQIPVFASFQPRLISASSVTSITHATVCTITALRSFYWTIWTIILLIVPRSIRERALSVTVCLSVLHLKTKVAEKSNFLNMFLTASVAGIAANFTRSAGYCWIMILVNRLQSTNHDNIRTLITDNCYSDPLQCIVVS